MTTIEQVIAVAAGQVGTQEYPANSNRQKYGVWYGWNGVPWCAQFLSWCFWQADGLALIGGKSASVSVIASRMAGMGRYSGVPRRGDLAIFNDYTHVELITSVNPNNTLSTVGGNTSGHAAGSISNGGGVFTNIRSRTLTRGYCHPGYTTAAAAPLPSPAGVPAFPLPDGFYFGPSTGPRQSVSGVYSNATDLARWQRRMHDRGWTIAADGRYGPQTSTVAQGFQRQCHLRITGQIDRGTWVAAWTAPVT